MYLIRMTNCAFFARHGVLDEEETLGQRFYVDAVLTVDADEALEKDSIASTVDYGVAFKVIEKIIVGERRFLIESLAYEVGRALTRRYPQIRRAEITVRKPNAPVQGVLEHVEVTVAFLNKERVHLSLGGNIGDPARAMGEALRLLEADPRVTVLAVSSLYRTPPWGKLDQPDFLNAAAQVETSLGPRAFLDLCLEAERKLKRVRRERWGPRLVDLDILTFGERSLNEPGLDIPHPRMMERAFVLAPLAEIAPDLVIGSVRVADRVAAMDTAGIVRQDGGTDWWRRLG